MANPVQVARALRGGARRARRRRRAHRALPQHPRPGARERPRRAAGRLRVVRVERRRARRLPRAAGRDRQHRDRGPRLRCCTRWASRPASTSTRSLDVARDVAARARPAAGLAHARRRADRLGAAVSVVLQSRSARAARRSRRTRPRTARSLDDLRDELARARAGGGPHAAERHAARGKLLARERVERLLDRGRAVPRALAAGRARPLRRRRARRGDRRGRRPRPRARGRRRRQRRDGQGRRVLPAVRQEAPARAGDRAAQPAAVHLPRRLRRRVPAAAGRDLPRPRALRPDLLQPGDDVGRRHRADRRRAWARARPAARTCRR